MFIYQYPVFILLAETHGNAMASLQDNKAAMKRKQATESNLEKDLNEKLKELDSLNLQLKVQYELLVYKNIISRKL
jgi:ribosomal protein L9